ncbi:MAG: ABC transporter permease [Cellulosilyticaceae bacterium]
MKKMRHLVVFLEGFVLFHLLWAIGARLMNTKALPSSLAVYANLPKVFSQSAYQHMGASFYRIFWGLMISLAIGLIIGILMGSFKQVNEILNPLVYFTYPVPKTALLPVVMILFGLGDSSKITIIVLITVFQVIVAVRDAILHIPQELYHSLKSLGASKLQMFVHVTFPAIVPELLTTLRLSVGTALSVLFFAENYGTKFGLGYYVQDSWTRIDYLSMYGGILLLAFLGFILFIAIDFMEQILCKWQKQ